MLSGTVYTRTLLCLQTDSLEHITHHHRHLLTEAVSCTSTSLVIQFKCPEIAENVALPDKISERLQAALATLYVIASSKAYQLNRPLLDVTVLLDGWSPSDLGSLNKTFDALLGDDRAQQMLQQVQSSLENPGQSAPPVHIIPTIDGMDGPVHEERDSVHLKSHHKYRSTGTFDTVVVGGTFDHLHSGHKILLTMTAWLAKRRVICGVTDDVMLQKKANADLIEPTSLRIERVRAFLNTIQPNLEYEVVPIFDAYGPTITDPNIQCIVVSEETRSGGDAVNVERAKRHFPPLQLFIVKVVSSTQTAVSEAEMKTAKMSSTFIRDWLR